MWEAEPKGPGLKRQPPPAPGLRRADVEGGEDATSLGLRHCGLSHPAWLASAGPSALSAPFRGGPIPRGSAPSPAASGPREGSWLPQALAGLDRGAHCLLRPRASPQLGCGGRRDCVLAASEAGRDRTASSPNPTSPVTSDLSRGAQTLSHPAEGAGLGARVRVWSLRVRSRPGRPRGAPRGPPGPGVRSSGRFQARSAAGRGLFRNKGRALETSLVLVYGL